MKENNLEKNSLENIGYFEVLQDLSKKAMIEKTKQNIQNLRPIYGIENKDEIQDILDATKYMIKLLEKNSLTLLDYDIFSLNLQVESNMLSIANLLNVFKIFLNSKEILKFFELENVKNPYLVKILENIYFNEKIYNRISKTIDLKMNILDSASSALKSIREKQKELQMQVKEVLNNILKKSKYIQENIITIRNGRYVIPVKSSCVHFVKGITHDISKNEQTHYVEPSQIININNRIEVLKKEEELEIQNILKDISILLQPVLDKLIKCNTSQILLDEIHAKAVYSLDNDFSYPIFSNEIHLRNTYHPQLKNKVEQRIIKNDIDIEEKYKTLIISRPNTGGKTVSLKTIGIVTALALSGIFIPAKPNSQLKIVDGIYSDIGDMQSIELDLSTFSSHMKNIVEILKNAKDDSLVLLDELGSGTDPNQGEALAIAIIKQLQKQNSLTIITSHYEKVKNFSLVNDKTKSSSVEFDIKTLNPTYRLNIGLPGKSYAFEISKKLGLNDNILMDAKNYVQTDDKTSNLIEKLNNLNSTLKIKEQELKKEKLNQEQKQKELDKLEKQLILKQEKLRNSKQDEYIKYLEKVKKEVAYRIKNLDNTNLKELNEIRNIANKKINESYEKKENINKTKDEKDKKIDKEKENLKENQKEENKINIKDLKIGDEVYSYSLKQKANVYSINLKNKKVRVQCGILKYDTNIEDLIFLGEKQDKKEVSTVVFSKENIIKNQSTSINLIGLNVDEAIENLDKFIDNCYISQIYSFTVIHGKGTGKLRDGLHKYLKNNPNVENFVLASYENGGAGATIVTLK